MIRRFVRPKRLLFNQTLKFVFLLLNLKQIYDDINIIFNYQMIYDYQLNSRKFPKQTIAFLINRAVNL